MTPLKDTLEVSNSSAESVSPPAVEAAAKPDSGGLRSDAVSLEVPVKVHGSRVTEVVRGITPHSEPFEEQTATMIVFPQGGVLRMATPVTAGQMMVVTNAKSGHDAICRVVKVRAYAQSQSYVEIEFTNRQPGYWGVRFAGDNVEPAKPFAPLSPSPSPAISTTVYFESQRSPETPAKPANPAPAAIAPPAVSKRLEPSPGFSSQKKQAATRSDREHAAQLNKKESSFVAIGAQEEVQPAASTTTFKAKIERPVAPAAPLSMSELRGDSSVAAPISTSLGSGVPGEMTDLSDDLEETSAHQQQAEQPHTLAVFTPAPVNTAPQKVFGARFDSIAPSAAESASEAPSSMGTSWFLIAAGIAALMVAAIGGAFYWHVLPGTKSNSPAGSAPLAVNLPAANSNIPTAPEVSGGVANVAPAPATQDAQQRLVASAPPASAPPAATRTIEPASASSNRAPAASAVNQKPAKVMPDMSGALTAHPVSAQRAAGDLDAAPSVDAGAPSSGVLQQMASAADVAPPPAPAPPVRVGGDVKSPKLISSVLPVYPSMARSSGIAGNVVVLVSVSPTGAVVGTKVLSGPAVLRQAAVEALRRWKYQPATLNGTPVAVDVTVTMSFHN